VNKIWEVGKTQKVWIKKITLGNDGRIYITLAHPDADNNPTFRLKKKMVSHEYRGCFGPGAHTSEIAQDGQGAGMVSNFLPEKLHQR
jgi:hypothetical protein